jgi:hypothetical protein
MTSQSDIAQFLAELQSYGHDRTKISGACTRLVTDLYDVYADNTVHATMTNYRNAMRKAISEGTLDAFALEAFRKPPEKSEERRKEYKTTLKRDLQQGRAIQNVDGLLNLAKSLLDSSSYIDIGLGLMLLTGRRPVEVFKTGNFTDDPTPYHVVFSGQAKTRDREEGQQPYSIPVFAEPTTIIHALAKLRSLRDFSNSSERDIHNRVSKTLNERFKKTFGPFLPESKPTHLRSLYATLAYEAFAPEGHYFPSYAADILGHGAEDTYTAQSYMDFHFTR